VLGAHCADGIASKVLSSGQQVLRPKSVHECFSTVGGTDHQSRWKRYGSEGIFCQVPSV